jgi:translation elongation factor EF-1alpha
MSYLAGVFNDRVLSSLEKDTLAMGQGGKKFAWLMDRKKYERERGITTDFSGLKIDGVVNQITVMDVPGQIHYIHNAARGLAGTDMALLVVSAVVGEAEAIEKTSPCMQHVIIAASMGTTQFFLAVNKMDMVL